MEWVLGITVILAAAVTMAIVGRMRTVRLQKKVRLELMNAGNVRSRYNLRAEGPEDALRFQFTLKGDSLPVYRAPSPSRAREPSRHGESAGRKAPSVGAAKGAMDKAGRVLQVGAAVAGVLSMVGSLLPRSIGGPLQEKASQIRHVQAKASYAQQTPERIAFQASSVAHTVTGKSGGGRPGRVIHPEEGQAQGASPSEGPTGDGFSWAQTPYVEPGASLVVDLLVRAVQPAGSQGFAPGGQGYTFQVISRAADAEVDPSGPQQARPVSAEGSVLVRGGFWARRFLPYVLVGTITTVLMVALVVLGYLLVAAGVLA
ncbi:MAG: hypothetical protein JXA93_00700 [Anaerolineae bacterium]|nr:hypothetical protein [Anaerolineae bacterium]